MPGKIQNSAVEKTEEDSLTGKLEAFMKNLVITTEPVVVTGVQRKANIGEFETLDVYCAVALPVSKEIDEELRQLIANVTEAGFQIASMETAIRYRKIKDSIKEDKKKK